MRENRGVSEMDSITVIDNCVSKCEDNEITLE